MGVKDIVKNIIHGVYNVIPHVLKDAVKHTKIKQISIKTINSISIPIYNQLSEDELDLIIEEANMEEEEGIRDQFAGMEEEINGDEE